MNALNHAVSAVFDACLWPLELLGRPWALVLASAVFGVVALFLFKYVSWQRRIRATKDKIKAHLIEVRIYQDDLRVASKAILKVLARNLQYLTLNLLPFVPLALPFAFVLAQFVVRYAFAPLPVHATGTPVVAGRGTMIEVELESGRSAQLSGLTIRYPAGVEPISPLARVREKAFQEVLVRAEGRHELVVELADGRRETKLLLAGAAGATGARGNGERGLLQGERAKGFFHALLWPAEETLASDSPVARIAFTYPDGELGWLPGGVGGVLLVFLVASMLGGALAIRPLKVQI